MSDIPKTMKALVAREKNDYRLEDIPVPLCGDDDVLVKTEACGICASDLKCFLGADTYWPGEGQTKGVKPPFVPGHECFGTIAKIGKNVERFKPGDRVTAEQILPCGKCRFCRTGRYWMCQPHALFGFHCDYNGGMAEYVLYPKNSILHPLPKAMDAKAALLIEPYSDAKHAVDRAGIGCEDVVVISGAGAIGLGMITYARLKNPAKLIALDISDERLVKAKEFGADICLNPAKKNAIARVLLLTEGYGCDIYIDAAGHPSSITQGLHMVRRLGTFVEFSVFAEDATINWSIIGDQKELDIFGAHLSPYCFPFVIENIQNGKLSTDGVVTKTFPLERWEEAFDAASGKYGDVKVALTF